MRIVWIFRYVSMHGACMSGPSLLLQLWLRESHSCNTGEMECLPTKHLNDVAFEQ